jgi:hypothetical protein
MLVLVCVTSMSRTNSGDVAEVDAGILRSTRGGNTLVPDTEMLPQSEIEEHNSQDENQEGDGAKNDVVGGRSEDEEEISDNEIEGEVNGLKDEIQRLRTAVKGMNSDRPSAMMSSNGCGNGGCSGVSVNIHIATQGTCGCCHVPTCECCGSSSELSDDEEQVPTDIDSNLNRRENGHVSVEQSNQLGDRTNEPVRHLEENGDVPVESTNNLGDLRRDLNDLNREEEEDYREEEEGDVTITSALSSTEAGNHDRVGNRVEDKGDRREENLGRVVYL